MLLPYEEMLRPSSGRPVTPQSKESLLWETRHVAAIQRRHHPAPPATRLTLPLRKYESRNHREIISSPFAATTTAPLPFRCVLLDPQPEPSVRRKRDIIIPSVATRIRKVFTEPEPPPSHTERRPVVLSSAALQRSTKRLHTAPPRKTVEDFYGVKPRSIMATREEEECLVQRLTSVRPPNADSTRGVPFVLKFYAQIEQEKRDRKNKRMSPHEIDEIVRCLSSRKAPPPPLAPTKPPNALSPPVVASSGAVSARAVVARLYEKDFYGRRLEETQKRLGFEFFTDGYIQK